MTRKILSATVYEARTTISQTITAETGTETTRETPKSSPAAAMPVNSAMVTAPFAISRTSIARTVQRTPNCSRISSARPLPVTVPSRAT